MGNDSKATGASANTTAEPVFGKMKTNSEISRLTTQIGFEQQKIAEDYIVLGKSFYNDRPDSLSDEEINACSDLDSRIAMVERVTKQINLLKGIKICPECKAPISSSYTFCGVCGARLEDIVPDPEILNISGQKKKVPEESK